MMHSCKYCGGIHPYGHNCPAKMTRTKIKTQQTDLRSTNRWTQKSIQIRKRDMNLCRVCLQMGTVNYNSIEVHHILPLEEQPEMAFEDGWLISLCVNHHKKADAGGLDREQLHRMAMETVPPLPNTLSRA